MIRFPAGLLGLPLTGLADQLKVVGIQGCKWSSLFQNPGTAHGDMGQLTALR